jgi:hypothetical protein
VRCQARRRASGGEAAHWQGFLSERLHDAADSEPQALFGLCERCGDRGAVGLRGHRVETTGSRYRSGRSPDWLKMKNPNAPAVKREAQEEWR